MNMALIVLSIAMLKETLKVLPSLAILFVSAFIILKAILNHDQEFIDNLFSAPWFLVHSQIGSCNDKNVSIDSINEEDEIKNQEKEEDAELVKEELQMVMSKLGIHCEIDKLEDSVGSGEILNMFDENEPSLEELREAFGVLDEKSDGFIDAEELQRLLYRLGLRQGYDLDNCRVMINSCDQNGDGKIDFSEFVKFMETTFC